MSEFNNFNVNYEPEPPTEKGFTVGGEEYRPVTNEQNKFNQVFKDYQTPVFDPEVFAEKQQLKSDARLIGASFLVLSGIIFLFNVVIVIASMIITKTLDMEAADLLWEPAVLQIQQILFASLSFTLPFIIIFKVAGIRISNLISFKKPEKKTVLPFLMFGVAFCSFANIASSIAESILKNANIDYEVTMPKNPTGFFGFALSLISTVLVPALVEEFACRGLMLGLLKKYGEGFAIVTSSLLFGLMHGNFEQMPFAFLVGLVLGFITVKSGTIWIAIAVHGFNNLIAVLFDYVFSNFSSSAQNIGYTIYLLTTLALGIFAIFLFHGKDENLYKFNSSNMKSTEKQKLIWFFTSIPIIIYVVICIIDSLQYFVI